VIALMGNHMDQEKLQLAKLVVKATIFIAACAMFHWAGAQNATENAQAVAARDAKELAERNRIAQERAKATKDYEAAREACYQQFAVNACLTTARNNYNTQVADLKRQDNSLSDVQRKRRGAEQVQRTEDKIANARPAQVPPQRGNALAAEPKRSERQTQPKAAKPSGAQAAKSRSEAAAAKQATARGKAAAHKSKMADAAKAKAQSVQRNKEADEHRAAVLSRQQNAKKKPAAPLPIPAN
jgi:colicin import membrane protein